LQSACAVVGTVTPSRDRHHAAPPRHVAAAIIDLVEKLPDVTVAGAHQSITAVPAPEDLATMLECELGAPLLRIDRLYFDRNGTPVYLALNHCTPARYSYRLEMRRSPR
jgi:GntR family transcriptional regulator